MEVNGELAWGSVVNPDYTGELWRGVRVRVDQDGAVQMSYD